MADAYYGINLHWGLGSTAVTVTNATGVYQNANYSNPTEKAETRDQRGKFIAVQYYNTVEKLTLEWLASDASSASGSAAISYPSTGTQVGITSDGPFSGSLWKTDSVEIRETNITNTSITAQFTRYNGF